jgi:hypothetical protein
MVNTSNINSCQINRPISGFTIGDIPVYFDGDQAVIPPAPQCYTKDFDINEYENFTDTWVECSKEDVRRLINASSYSANITASGSYTALNGCTISVNHSYSHSDTIYVRPFYPCCDRFFTSTFESNVFYYTATCPSEEEGGEDTTYAADTYVTFDGSFSVIAACIGGAIKYYLSFTFSYFTLNMHFVIDSAIPVSVEDTVNSQSISVVFGGKTFYGIVTKTGALQSSSVNVSVDIEVN